MITPTVPQVQYAVHEYIYETPQPGGEKPKVGHFCLNFNHKFCRIYQWDGQFQDIP